MARIKDKSVRDVVDAVEHRRGRRAAHVAAQELGHALHGPLPVSRGALGELLGQLRPQPLPLLRLRQGRRRRHVRARDRGPRLRRRDRVAGRALPDPARVRGELAAGRRGAQAPRAPLRGARSGGVVLRAPPLGRRRRGARARVSREPRSRRGGLEGVPARPLAGQRPGGEGAREGLHGRRAARRRADEPARQRLLPATADVPARRRARQGDRLPGAQAPRRRSAARASTSTRPRATSSRRAASSTASTSRVRRSRSRTAPSWSRATPT